VRLLSLSLGVQSTVPAKIRFISSKLPFNQAFATRREAPVFADLTVSLMARKVGF